VLVTDARQSVARPGQAPTPPVAVNLPLLLEWTNELLPVQLVMEVPFVSQDPRALVRAAEEAARLQPLGMRRLREADVLHDQGKLMEALAAYDRVLPLAPEGDASWAARVAARRGQTLLELGRLDEAEGEFRRALAQAPPDSGVATAARVGLAMALLARGQVEAARVEASAAVAAASAPAAGTAPASLALALVEIRRGEPAAASAALERALAADDQNGQARAWRSYLLRARNDLAGAEKEAREAVARAPYSATCRRSLADLYLLQGRAAAARREAQQAVALDPLSAAAHVSLANAELLSGRVEAAVREAHQGVALSPRSDRAHATLGAALAEQRRYRRAERHLRRAVELNPDLLDARSLLGRVLTQQGQRAAAVEVARGTLERNPELPSARAALGQVYRLQGRLSDAAREYEAALAASPRNGLYHLEVARVYLDQNNLPAALSQAQESVYLLPGSGEAHAILGLVYDRQENREQAAREYREAISLSPENSLARLGLVTAFGAPTFALLGSGRLGLRERAQALLRDPSVLQQTFRPGVTSELAGGLGGDSHDEQGYLHRGQSAQGRVHDFVIASRLSDDGYRANSATRRRLLQSDVAIQATPSTEVLLQYLDQKHNGGLPGSVISEPSPINRFPTDRNAHASRRQDDYGLNIRQYLGRETHLWLSHGVRTVRNSRRDPDATARFATPLPDLEQELSLYRIDQHQTEHVTELRLDHRLGRHRLTYGLADLRDNVRLFDLKLALPGEMGTSGQPPSPALEVEGTVFARDFLQYVQDDYRLGKRGSLIVGAQQLRTRERQFRELRSATLLPSGMPSMIDQRRNTTRHDLLPYLAFTYELDARNLVRLIGNATRLRLGDPLLAPSEAFLVGEPISLNHDGRAETYELDYERRFSPRTFAKLFLQSSRARDFIIQPTLDQRLVPVGVVVPRVRAQIAGLRIEHQINRYLSAFTRWSYWKVEDRSLDRQVPFNPRWRGLTGLHYADRKGAKISLTASFLSRQFTDVLVADEPAWYTTIYQPPFFVTGLRPSTGSRVVYDLRIAMEPSVRLEYSLTVTNLFNKRYPDWPNFPARGRAWFLSAALRY
jgi:tetratricopeptide (TPR) repeat protein